MGIILRLEAGLAPTCAGSCRGSFTKALLLKISNFEFRDTVVVELYPVVGGAGITRFLLLRAARILSIDIDVREVVPSLCGTLVHQDSCKSVGVVVVTVLLENRLLFFTVLSLDIFTLRLPFRGSNSCDF